ncbi:MAG TPA: HD-GYP domain-containing protein [Candidatus Limnocylindrales bacterium]|nr:HD-GYP domain-containing protein [Candidatus Limnocylindrales bacterium]
MIIGDAHTARRELTTVLSSRRVSQIRRRENWIVLAAACLIPLTTLLAFASVRLTGGSPNPLNHLGYLPILIAAYTFGWRGAVPLGMAVAVVLGPLAALMGLAGGVEQLDAWAIRAAMYVVVAAFTGVMFDRAREATLGWRTAAIEIAQRQRDGMVALARGAEAKDTDTGDHIGRVQLLSEELARAVGLDSEEAANVGWSAMLHDVGKLHIPDGILLKPGPLTADEWDIMRRHPVFGEQILREGTGFEMARRIARWHHENVDGSGYPDGLKGTQIPLEARIVRVADAFDAITNVRPYKAARSVEWAIEELKRCAGTDFDPEIARLLVDMLEGDPALVARLGSHRILSAA